MSDLLPDIRARLIQDYNLVERAGHKHLRKGVCPRCGHKSLWTFAETPWVVRCERLNNCGWEAHAKELYPDLFESWSDRVQQAQASQPQAERSPTAVADAYLSQGRGFSLGMLRGLYTQESHYDARADGGRGAGSATVRFAFGETWWERLIDRPGRFGKQKARFKPGASYAGQWWQMPALSFDAPPPGAPPEDAPPAELWLVEGIFDAIALAHHGIAAVACLSCSNYPAAALDALDAHIKRQGGQVKHPTLVWALDGDKAGRDYTLRHVRRARDAGWTCTAAQIPQRGRAKADWNDMHQRGRLEPEHLAEYRYHGALMLAASPQEKALLIYERESRAEFDFDHGNRLYWWKLDQTAFAKARDDLKKQVEDGSLSPAKYEQQLREQVLACKTITRLANCLPQCLYYQKNEVTDEAWYYFRVSFPDDRAALKGTFTAGQLTACAEFEKRLLHMAPGAMFSGSAQQLKQIMARQLERPKEVQTVDFIGYSALHQAYLLGQVAVREGAIHEVNAEDYFDFDRLSLKSLQKSIRLSINTRADEYDRSWFQHLWAAFGAKGVVALAFWFGSLFAEQVRMAQQSFPFMEIVGEPGSGKTTLLQFLWKLMGRDYEGFDPSKSTAAGRLRTFTQVSNLPIVLIESDREQRTGGSAHVRSFDWDELKDAYNGNPIRTTGVKTGGNETYDPPFRASIVISQNNTVQASQPVMERICHMTFDTSRFSEASFAAARALEQMDIEQVSGFVLAALRREADVVADINGLTDEYMRYLLAQDGIHKPRIAKNHAQLMAMAKALRRVVRMSDEQAQAVNEQILTMARERQAAINADPPMVAEFWETFDYLDSLGVAERSHAEREEGANVWQPPKPLLNHSRQPDQIAVNLNEFVERAAAHRQQVPPLAELKKTLRMSKTRRFVAIKSVNSAIRTRMHGGEEIAKTVHCWIFERGHGH